MHFCDLGTDAQINGDLFYVQPTDKAVQNLFLSRGKCLDPRRQILRVFGDGLNKIGHIILDPHEMSKLPATVVDGRNGEFIPEQSAILSVISQQDTAEHTVPDCAPKRCHRFLILVVILQKSAVLAENGTERVTSQIFERGIRIYDGIVGEPRISNQQAVLH